MEEKTQQTQSGIRFTITIPPLKEVKQKVAPKLLKLSRGVLSKIQLLYSKITQRMHENSVKVQKFALQDDQTTYNNRGAKLEKAKEKQEAAMYAAINSSVLEREAIKLKTIQEDIDENNRRLAEVKIKLLLLDGIDPRTNLPIKGPVRKVRLASLAGLKKHGKTNYLKENIEKALRAKQSELDKRTSALLSTEVPIIKKELPNIITPEAEISLPKEPEIFVPISSEKRETEITDKKEHKPNSNEEVVNEKFYIAKDGSKLIELDNGVKRVINPDGKLKDAEDPEKIQRYFDEMIKEGKTFEVIKVEPPKEHIVDSSAKSIETESKISETVIPNDVQELKGLIVKLFGEVSRLDGKVAELETQNRQVSLENSTLRIALDGMHEAVSQIHTKVVDTIKPTVVLDQSAAQKAITPPSDISAPSK